MDFDRFIQFLGLFFLMAFLAYAVLVEPRILEWFREYGKYILSSVIVVAGLAAFGFILWAIWHSREPQEAPPHQPFTPKLRK